MISILFVLNNNLENIFQSIESICDQTFKDYEIIILYSVDTILSDVLKWIWKNKERINIDRICSIKAKDNICTSLNEGIFKSHGESICWLFAGDLMAPDRLDTQWQVLKKKDVVASLGLIGNIYQRPQYSEKALMIKRKVIKKIGYFDSTGLEGLKEFMDRLDTVYGEKGIIHVDELILDTDLTNIKKESSHLEEYIDAYKKWHQNKKLYMEYPLKRRPFYNNLDPS